MVTLCGPSLPHGNQGRTRAVVFEDGTPDTAKRRYAESPDAEPLVAVHVALPLLPAAELPLALPPEPPVDNPVEHPVHAIHGATTRDRCPRPAYDRSIGVRYDLCQIPFLPFRFAQLA